MHTLSRDSVKRLLAPQPGPCLSLYQTTHRTHPDNAGDIITYKNLVRRLGEALSQRAPAAEQSDLLAPLHRLAEDHEFWRYTLDGLAILLAPDFLRVYALPRPVPNLAIVADTWHIKPLLRHAQTVDHFQVLCLTRDKLWLCEGNRHEMYEMEPAPQVPRTIEDALGDQLTAPYLKVSTRGPGPTGGPGATVRHGHGDKSDELDIDIPRFFRVADRAVHEYHSRPGGLPLILAALPKYQAIFRKLSNNPLLMPEGIEIDPGSLNMEGLRARAWTAVVPHYHRETRALLERFRARHGTGLATDDLREMARAATSGRVQTLLVDADRQIPGRIDVHEGTIDLADNPSASGANDLLDDLAEIVLRRDGDVFVIPGDIMPSGTGVAALLRY
ncbi:MAG: hypothetical protein EPN41_00710 [Candidimonas sp.]|nr:MAG: hypothetical protein EPN41_00710 [Candidimonas sp.]